MIESILLLIKVYSILYNLFLPTLCRLSCPQILWLQKALLRLQFFAPAVSSACKTLILEFLAWLIPAHPLRFTLCALLLEKSYLPNTSPGTLLMSSHETLYLFLSQHLSLDCHSCLLVSSLGRLFESRDFFSSVSLVLSPE